MTQEIFRLFAWAAQPGGLDAYIRLLRHLPADLGVAIVIVNHLRAVATPTSNHHSHPDHQPAQTLTPSGSEK